MKKKRPGANRGANEEKTVDPRKLAEPPAVKQGADCLGGEPIERRSAVNGIS
jgi:hypothetical protein